MTTEETLAILRSWYLIEMMSPNTVKVEKKMLKPEWHLKLDDKKQTLPELPWEKKEPELNLQVDEGEDEEAGDNDAAGDGDVALAGDEEEKEDGYIFYLGITLLSDAYNAIRSHLDFDDTFVDAERRRNDYCAFASVRLTLEGTPVPDSLTISTLPWYLGKIRDLGLERVLTEPIGSDFEKFCMSFRETIFARLNPVFSAEDFKSLAEAVIEACKPGDIKPVYTFAGKREKFDPNEPPGLLNSFYHEDVADAIALLRTNKLPPLYASLFSTSPQRLDVYRDEADLFAVLNGGNALRSAWPAKTSKLSLMQHAAVMAAGSDEARCIVTVNGPPGTGKTTLLKSFVAENVVKRAEQLALLESPSRAWTQIREASEKNPAIYSPTPNITGFEMLVASSNNGAIENVTKDAPLEASVDGFNELVAEIDHFASVALNVANHLKKPSHAIVRTWGLISAALGAKDKRRKFIKPFLSEAKTDVVEGVETIEGFVARNGRGDWDAARRAFTAALNDLKRHSSENGSNHDVWRAFDEKNRQLNVPNVDDQAHRLQAKVFLRALVLHRMFVQATWREMKSNLTAWSRLAMRPLATDLTREEISAVWQSFFLVCPVVSTTFASARRMLAGVPFGLFGWALIDEAGQATPQAATGVMLRCKRALIVGDPLQLEPIVSLSTSLVRLIAKTYHADVNFIASPDNGQSLQTVADRCSVHGTSRVVELSDGTESKEWIGVPLLVHRRCLEPMFSLSNAIYRNEMVSEVVAPKDVEDRFPWGESAWIDQGGSSNPHAVDDQIELALQMILALKGHYNRRRTQIDQALPGNLTKEQRAAATHRWTDLSVSVISPFRQVEEEMRTRIDDYPPLTRWGEKRIGTIHKFQGKESEAVILILGLDTSHAGAAQFATSKPNMMNVAVTRAKHRLYVIGNADVWGDTPHFGDVYEKMKSRKAIHTGDDFLARMRESMRVEDHFMPPRRGERKPKRPRRTKK